VIVVSDSVIVVDGHPFWNVALEMLPDQTMSEPADAPTTPHCANHKITAGQQLFDAPPLAWSQAGATTAVSGAYADAPDRPIRINFPFAIMHKINQITFG